MLNFLERTNGDYSPFQVSCANDNGRASAAYLLSNITSSDTLQADLIQLIGDTQYSNSGSEKLNRLLPAIHPFMPYYCSAVQNLRGVGGTYQQKVIAIPPLSVFTPQIQNYCLYSQYELNADFTPRSYPIYDNNAIQLVQSSWYQDDGTRAFFTYATEYERYCDLTITPSSDSVALQLGQMAFNADQLDANSRPFVGSPRIFLNNEILKVTWYQVPLRLYTSDNSYLRKFRGRINQNKIASKNLGNYDIGQLLYLGCQLKPYTPPFSNAVVYGAGLVNFERLVNVEMTFLYTFRELGDSPKFPPRNLNYVVAGHNLQPFFGTPAAQCAQAAALANAFLYCSTVDTSCAASCPLFKSAPLELLTSDCDFQTVQF